MKRSTRYRLHGIYHVIRGTVIGIVARISAKRVLAARGKLETTAGRLQGRIGRVHGSVGL